MTLSDRTCHWSKIALAVTAPVRRWRRRGYDTRRAWDLRLLRHSDNPLQGVVRGERDGEYSNKLKRGQRFDQIRIWEGVEGGCLLFVNRDRECPCGVTARVVVF